MLFVIKKWEYKPLFRLGGLGRFYRDSVNRPKPIDLICPSSNTTLVVSYTIIIIEEIPHLLATNRLFATKERIPVAIESDV